VRFFLDENETSAVLPPLQAVFFEHEFKHAAELGFGGRTDTELITEVAELGFDAIITRDRNQLRNPAERQAYVDAGIHWIGHAEPAADGLLLIATISAAYLAAMPHVFEGLTNAVCPTAFHVKKFGLLPEQRLKVRPIKPA
jgi:hypothetical protein